MPVARLKNVEMHYEEVGEGEPLLLTTGWALAERAFVQHRELFAGHYRCIRHDHRGMGRSSSPDAPWTIRDLADDLRDLLDHLGLERIRVLGGGGMGALVAAELAINHPEKVGSLQLGAPCVKVDNFLRAVMLMWKDLRRLDPVLWAREVTLWCYTPQSFAANPDLVDGAAKARGGEDTFPKPGSFDRTVDAYLGFDVTDTIHRIACPTLITNAGSQDLITGSRFAREVYARIPGARLHIFENCSHNYWVEAREEWGRLTLDWFASAHPGSAAR